MAIFPRKNSKTQSSLNFLQSGPRKFWAAANGGVTNGGLRGVWPPFSEIGRNRPFSPFFCLFRPFPEDAKSTWKIQKTEEKGLFPQISSDFLKPPSLKPPFAAPQLNRDFGSSILAVFPRKNSKTQSSLNFLQSGPRKFTKLDFSGSKR